MEDHGSCPTPTGVVSNHRLRGINNSLSIYLWILMILLSGIIPLSGFNSQCGFGDCWDLYQQAQESLRISDMYPLTWVSKHSLPSASLMPTEIEKRCTAFRTFHKCLAMASRGCLGDLNFHSAHKGTEKQMNLYGCPLEGLVFEQQFPLANPIPLACTYNEGSSEDSDMDHEHRICSIFGNLHLSMFDHGYQTCNIVGAWPMVDNEHFTIQVTAEKYHLASKLAKVTVVIKQDEECAMSDRYVLYQATSFELPSTFADGSTAFGAFDSIKIEEVEPNQHVVITMRHIDTIIWIHNIHQVLSIFIKTPDEFTNSLDAKLNSVQLCFIGCPSPMQVNVRSFFKSPVVQYRSEDETSTTSSMPRGGKPLYTLPHSDGFEPINYETSFFVCRSSESDLKGYFMNSCIYDIMSSGDSSLSILSAVAMNATLTLGGKVDEMDELTEQNVRRHVSGASLLEPCSMLMTLLFICIIFNHSMNEIFTLKLSKHFPPPSNAKKSLQNITKLYRNLLCAAHQLTNVAKSFLQIIMLFISRTYLLDFPEIVSIERRRTNR